MRRKCFTFFAVTLMLGLLSACSDQKNEEADLSKIEATQTTDEGASAEGQSESLPESQEESQSENQSESETVVIDESDVTVREEYHLKLHGSSRFDVTYTDKFIRVSYEMQSPELRAESTYEVAEGEFVLTDEFFVQSIQEPLEKLKSIEESFGYDRKDLELLDDGYKMFQFLSKSQKRDNDMGKLYGEEYYKVYGKEMDCNGDGKVTVDESYAYWVSELVPGTCLLEDTRGAMSEEVIQAWKAKGLIPATKQTGSFKTQEQVCEVVLNGVSYRVGEDTLHKLFENGLIIDSNVNPTDTVYGGGFLYCHFSGMRENDISIDFHSVDYSQAPIEECIIDKIEFRIPQSDATLYSWKCGPLTVDGNTLRQELLDYFEMSEYGDKTLHLYMPEYMIEFYFGNARRDNYQGGSYFQIRASMPREYGEEPEWAE